MKDTTKTKEAVQIQAESNRAYINTIHFYKIANEFMGNDYHLVYKYSCQSISKYLAPVYK